MIYRDVRHVVPFAVQVGLFLSPVIYPSSEIVAALAERGLPGWVVGLNPMAGALECFRWAVLGAGTVTPGLVTASVVVTLLLGLSGLWFFRGMERYFADVV